MNIDAIAESLESTGTSEFLRSQFWFVPALQSIHILAVCFVLTGFAIIFARSWSIAGIDWTRRQWANRLAPLLTYGFVALLVTGLLQILAEPTRELPNWVFQTKVALIVAALPFAVWLVRRFGVEARTSPLVRGLSLLIGIVVLTLIFAGRWIAYA